jgi:predicted TIM-barrel fold metal-dependent hydrolase
MDGSDVAKAVLVQTINYGWDHSYALDCRRQHQERLAIVGLVDPADPDAPDKLEQLVWTDGVGGLRLLPYHTSADWGWLNHPSIYPLWEKAAELAIPINLAIRPYQMKALEDMVARFSLVKVIVDHLGTQNPEESPSYPSAESLLRLADYPNVYVKVSGFRLSSKHDYPYSDCIQLVERIYNRFGASRLMWGSDFPYAHQAEGYARALGFVDHLTFLSESDREWLLGKTALGLYRFAQDDE